MTSIRIQRTSITFALVRLIWRFLSGAHLNGQTYNDATWWRDASPHYRKRRIAWTWWRRKSRMKRVAWRHSIMWPVLLITGGMVLERMLTVILLLCMMPGAFVIAFQKTRLLLYQPVKAHHNDGHVTQSWVMRPRTRHVVDALLFRRIPIGLAKRDEKKKKPRAIPVPTEYANAVRAEVSSPELDWVPPTEMKLLMTPDDEGGDVLCPAGLKNPLGCAVTVTCCRASRLPRRYTINPLYHYTSEPARLLPQSTGRFVVCPESQKNLKLICP